MNKLGAWLLTEKTAIKLYTGTFDYEKELEELIENDPSLIEPGLKIVGRQSRISSGFIDLLGINTQGQFTVIEIKRGSLFREAVAQAIDYASEIARMQFNELKNLTNEYLRRIHSLKLIEDIIEELKICEDDSNDQREVTIKVVGAGNIGPVERMINYINVNSRLSLEAIGFQIFETGGDKLLVRELGELATSVTQVVSIESVIHLAAKYGTEKIFNAIIEFAKKNNLKLHPYKTSLMVAPFQHGNRCLFTVWTEPHPDKRIQTYVAVDAFEQFYSISPDIFQSRIGKKGYEKLSFDELIDFLNLVDKILNDFSVNK